MKKVFAVVSLVLMLCFSASSTEVSSIDSSLHGRWNLVALSQDGGQTIEKGAGTYFGTCTPTKFKSSDGRVLTLFKVTYIEENGIEYTCIGWNELDEVIWVISYVDDETIMVQTIDHGRETIRVLFSVNK